MSEEANVIDVERVQNAVESIKLIRANGCRLILISARELFDCITYLGTALNFDTENYYSFDALIERAICKGEFWLEMHKSFSLNSIAPMDLEADMKKYNNEFVEAVDRQIKELGEISTFVSTIEDIHSGNSRCPVGMYYKNGPFCMEAGTVNKIFAVGWSTDKQGQVLDVTFHFKKD